MAMLDAVPGVKVQVFVNGEPLQEYDCDGDSGEENNDEVVTKFIVAESGKNFEVRYSWDEVFRSSFSKGQGIAMRVDIDGKRVFGCVHVPQHLDDFTERICSGSEYCVDGQDYEQKFRFSELSVGKCTMSLVVVII
jgi:hypothetical protein